MHANLAKELKFYVRVKRLHFASCNISCNLVQKITAVSWASQPNSILKRGAQNGDATARGLVVILTHNVSDTEG